MSVHESYIVIKKNLLATDKLILCWFSWPFWSLREALSLRANNCPSLLYLLICPANTNDGQNQDYQALERQLCSAKAIWYADPIHVQTGIPHSPNRQEDAQKQQGNQIWRKRQQWVSIVLLLSWPTISRTELTPVFFARYSLSILP